MLVAETHEAGTLTLDIEAPGGTLSLEYGEDSLHVDLDGEFEWQDGPFQVPYYTLLELAKRLVSCEELGYEGDWVECRGYRLRLKKGQPAEVEYLGEWTLYVEEFTWQSSGSGP